MLIIGMSIGTFAGVGIGGLGWITYHEYAKNYIAVESDCSKIRESDKEDISDYTKPEPDPETESKMLLA